MHERYPPVRHEAWLRSAVRCTVRAPVGFADTGGVCSCSPTAHSHPPGGFKWFIQGSCFIRRGTRDPLLTTDVSRSTSCSFGRATVPAYPVSRFSNGCRCSFGAWRNANEHHCCYGCFGLLGGGCAMVLVWPPLGFSGLAATLPLYRRSASIIPECARKIPALWSRCLVCCKILSWPESDYAATCRCGRSAARRFLTV